MLGIECDRPGARAPGGVARPAPRPDPPALRRGRARALGDAAPLDPGRGALRRPRRGARVPRVSRPDPARAELDRRVRAWMAEPWAEDDARFDALALELFAFQFEHCAPYARFCEGRGRTPRTLRAWHEIPAVPTGAFKELALRSFPAERTCKVFRTSGTSLERRGALALDTLDGVRGVAAPELRALRAPGPGRRRARPLRDPRALARRGRRLLPLPHVRSGGRASREPGERLLRAGRPAAGRERLLPALRRAAERGEALALCGTAFAFVHLLEAPRGLGRAHRPSAREPRHGDRRLQGPRERAEPSELYGCARGAPRPAAAPRREPVRDDRARQPVLRHACCASRRRRAASSGRPGRACGILDPATRRGVPAGAVRGARDGRRPREHRQRARDPDRGPRAPRRRRLRAPRPRAGRRGARLLDRRRRDARGGRAG